MTEKARFLARLGESREAGLVDIKFFFHPAKATTPEEIFAALNEVEDAINSGASVLHDAWDDNDEPVLSA